MTDKQQQLDEIEKRIAELERQYKAMLEADLKMTLEEKRKQYALTGQTVNMNPVANELYTLNQQRNRLLNEIEAEAREAQRLADEREAKIKDLKALGVIFRDDLDLALAPLEFPNQGK